MAEWIGFCGFCEKPLKAPRTGRRPRWCSTRCSRKAKRGTPPERECGVCGEMFVGRRIWCSSRCREKAKYRRGRGLDLRTGRNPDGVTDCVVCGKPLDIGQRGPRPRWCSRECYDVSNPPTPEQVERAQELSRLRAQKHREQRLAEVLVCEHCGASFTRPNPKVRKFCSRECGIAASREKTKLEVNFRKGRDRDPFSKVEYDAQLARQGGTCSICRRSPSGRWGLYIDHDHETGKIRGLLCSGCNAGLGQLGDTAESVYRAYLYLAEAETLVQREA